MAETLSLYLNKPLIPVNHLEGHIYASLLEITSPERKLYVAISEQVYDDFFTLESVQVIIERLRVPLIVVNLENEEIVKWIS